MKDLGAYSHKDEWLCLPLSLLHVKVQHLDLKASHDQLALTLEDHKSALAAAQVGQQH